MVTDINSLLKERGFGEKSFRDLQDTIETYSTCGAYVKPASGGIIVGAQVVGCDKAANEITLFYPFDEKELENALNTVENEADELFWNDLTVEEEEEEVCA